MEISQIPADFLHVLELRIYLDNTEEIISLRQKVSRPPRYVIYTPILFNLWIEWADMCEQEKIDTEYIRQSNNANYGEITPFGVKIGPAWMKYEFKGLEDFHQYYTKLIEV